MKTKLRRFVSIFSAMVLMVCCAVPAFAVDTVEKNDFSTVKWSVVNSTSDIPHSSDVISYYSERFDTLPQNYALIYTKNSSGDVNTSMIWLPDDSLMCYYFTDNQFRYLSHSDFDISRASMYFYANGNNYKSFYSPFRFDNSPTPDYKYSGILYHFGVDGFDISSAKVYIHSKLYDWDNFDNKLEPSAPPVPFIVDYSPALSEGMSRKGTLVAPGASNDGQEIESNGLNVRVTLTDEFLKLRDSYDELKDYTYEFVCYITTSPPEKSSYEESVKNAVYTSLDYGKYMYTTSGVVDDVTDDNKEPAEWIKAEGINAGYIIGKGGSVKNVTINLENLDSSQFTADTKLYIVVYGRLTSLSVPTPDYFDLDNQGYLCNQGSLNTKQIVTVNADPETGEGTDVVMPDYYCVTSTAFNYKDYPEYKPKIFKNGAEMDTNKPFTDYLDKKLTPDYMYDYDMDKNGESGLAPDDFEKYEEQKNLDKNFGSVDFGLDSIKSVFDGSSDFFKFLTASIGILPTTFLTILISFFVVMLAICVVKWVLK